MMNNEIKMPAGFAVIDENEMEYLQGGGAPATAWDVFLNVGRLFSQLARVFSSGSSIISNVNVIVTTIDALMHFNLLEKKQ